MDIFKSLGITVGEAPSLVVNKSTEMKEEDVIGGQFIRKGMGTTSRDRLDEQLSKGSVGIPMTTILNVPVDVIEGLKKPAVKKTSSEGLKNTHGEDWHKDNDKQVEEMVSNEEEFELSMHNDGILFLKAMGEKVSMPKKKFVKEHKDLVETLESPSHEDDKDEAKEQSAELKRIAKKSDSLFETVKDNKKKALKIANMHENSPGVSERRKPMQIVDKSDVQGEGEGLSPLDELVGDIRKAEKTRFQEYTEEWKEKNKKAKKAEDCEETDKSQGIVKVKDRWASKYPPAVNPAQKSFQFIKSVGKGGMVFDFGPKTGNPVADHATMMINQHGDPTQMQIAKYQADSYDKAIGEYVNKGEQTYMKQPSTFGDVNDGWKNQLEKPMDQQVKEAFAKGELDNADPSAPAVKNDYNKTELKLGGQIIKATSETDAALINMMKAQMENERASDNGGFVADASTGGRISVTAGDPLPELN
jgi:hypothetical protein